MKTSSLQSLPASLSPSGLLVLVALLSGTAPATAAPLPTTATITENDIIGLAGGAGSFWVFDTFDVDGPGVGGDPTLDLATMPTPLAGYGSTAARLSTGPGTGGAGCNRLGGKAFLGTRSLDGTRLNELLELGYSYLVDSTSGVPSAVALTPAINIYVDRNGDGIWRSGDDSILIYEPYYTLGNPTQDIWYDNIPIGPGAVGRWHYAAQSLPGLGLFVPNTVDLWAEVIAQPVGGAGFDPTATTIGDLRIVNPDPGCSASDSQEGTGNGLSVVVGQKSGAPWNNYVAFVDGIYLTAGGNNPVTFVHNFDTAPPVPASAVIISGANQSAGVETAFDPLVVELRDAGGDPVGAGAVASIVVPASGASATLAQTTESVVDASGRVRFYPVANSTTGTYTLEVRSTEDALLTSTQLSNTPAATPSTVVVPASEVQGLAGDASAFWTVDYYDTNPSTDNPSGSLAGTVNAAPAGGFSSLQLRPGGQEGSIGGNPAACSGAGGIAYVGTTELDGMALRDLDRLGYAAMLQAVGVEDGPLTLLPSVQLFVDFNDDGQWLPADDGILVYDPAHPGNLPQPYALGQWYDLPDLASPASAARWLFRVRSPFAGSLGLDSADPDIDTFQELLYHPALVPAISGGSRLADLRLVNPIAGCDGSTATEGTGSGLAFAFGQKSGAGYSNMVAHIDGIRLDTSGGGLFDLSRFHDFAAIYSVDGTVSGLAGSGLVLQNNASDDLSIDDNGAFEFAPLIDGSDYAVTVLAQPDSPSQTCTVSNGSGSLAGADVTDVAVSCVTSEFAVSGMVTGLAGSGLVLQNNGGDSLIIVSDGAFAFAPQSDGSDFAVTVLSQPDNLSQTCTVSNGSGALAGANVTDVLVSCATNVFAVGGMVTGLAGSGLVMQNNGGDNIAVAADGAFGFAELSDGSAFAITVLSQPDNPSQTCTVSGGSGTLAGADVNDVLVSCVTDGFTVGGVVTGLEGSGLALQINGGGDLIIAADGPFEFPPLSDGSVYAVAVLNQPVDPSQTCTVGNGNGSLAGANVTNLSVNCVTRTFAVGGTVSGLAGSGLVLQNNGGDDLAIVANGSFSFGTALLDGSSFSVAVLSQPDNPGQTCVVSNGTGDVAGAIVTAVGVECSDAPPSIVLPSAALDLGVVTVGNSASGTVTIGNSGSGDLVISSLTEPAAPFSIMGGSCTALPVTLASGESCEIVVRFAPSGQTGAFAASISLVSNAASSPDTIQLSGAAQASAPAVVPTLDRMGLMLLVLMLTLFAGLKLSRAR